MPQGYFIGPQNFVRLQIRDLYTIIKPDLFRDQKQDMNAKNDIVRHAHG